MLSLWGICMFSLCLHDLPSGTPDSSLSKDMKVRLTVNSKLPVCVNVGVNSCHLHQCTTVSRYTINHFLNQSKLHGRKPMQSTLLKDKQWRTTEWSLTKWRLTSHKVSGQMSSRQMKQNESFLIRHISSVYTEERIKLSKNRKNIPIVSGGGLVLLWGCFAVSGTGSLESVQGTVK